MLALGESPPSFDYALQARRDLATVRLSATVHIPSGRLDHEPECFVLERW
jgi:hypothetical protein